MTNLEPRQAVVVLEPADHATLTLERESLMAGIALPVEIATPKEYAALADLERRLGDFINRTRPQFDRLCQGAHAVWQDALGIRKQFTDGPEQLKARIRQLLGAYKDREERQRRDEELRLALEEQRREEARRTREAKLAEKQGSPELARAIRETPVVAPTIVLPSALPNVGLTYRTDWSWRPIGGDTPANRQRAIRMLVREEWSQFLKFDDAALRTFANKTKGTVRVPGLEFFSTQVPVRR